MGTKYTPETPVTPELIIGAIALELRAIADELEANGRHDPARVDRIESYAAALGIDL